MMEKLKLYATPLLRIGIALVFLWFGTDQIMHTSQWIGFIPDWATNLLGIKVETIVYMNAVFEIIFGSALLFGFFTRVTACLLALHLIEITYTVGMSALGVRDFGLTIATIAIWFNGLDFLTLDTYLRKPTVPVLNK